MCATLLQFAVRLGVWQNNELFSFGGVQTGSAGDAGDSNQMWKFSLVSESCLVFWLSRCRTSAGARGCPVACVICCVSPSTLDSLRGRTHLSWLRCAVTQPVGLCFGLQSGRYLHPSIHHGTDPCCLPLGCLFASRSRCRCPCSDSRSPKRAAVVLIVTLCLSCAAWPASASLVARHGYLQVINDRPLLPLASVRVASFAVLTASSCAVLCGAAAARFSFSAATQTQATSPACVSPNHFPTLQSSCSANSMLCCDRSALLQWPTSGGSTRWTTRGSLWAATRPLTKRFA